MPPTSARTWCASARSCTSRTRPGKSTKYTIVGSAEASPAEMKLSNESPVGKALLGHKRGEEVVFSTPRGERKLKITKIDVGTK